MWTLAGDGTQVEPANEATEDLTRQTATDELGIPCGRPSQPPGAPLLDGPADGDRHLDKESTKLEIAALVREGSPRSRGEDPTHIQRLVETEGPLPPILVHRPTMRILDGFHRVAAAIRKGMREIDVVFVDASAEAAFIVAVEANVNHGLPLSLGDRRAAAIRILGTHPGLSDRAIAKSTGLCAKTVAALRSASADFQQLHERLGRDGRVRPLNASAGRQLAAELLASQPNASLREIAEASGISPGTVRDVRARMRRGDDPVPTSRGGKYDRLRSRRSRPSPGNTTNQTHEAADVKPVLLMLSRDPALRMSARGRDILRWLYLHAVNGVDSTEIAQSVPDHCVEHLVEFASRCSANWAKIADDLSHCQQKLHFDHHPAEVIPSTIPQLPVAAPISSARPPNSKPSRGHTCDDAEEQAS
jgi:ParB-like chromosome segregation protein Spo0J